jgi:hypothetical protein
MRSLGDARHGQHGTEGVRDVRDRDEAGAVGEQRRNRVGLDLSGIRHRCYANARARLRGHELPGNDVGMVLERRDDDLVTGAEERARPALGHEVDSLGGTAREDDLVDLRGAQKPCYPGACRIVCGGRVRAQPVDAAMDVRVLLRIEAGDPIDDAARLLAGGRAVEIDQWPAIDRRRQDREVVAHRRHIEDRSPDRRHERDRHGGHLSRAFRDARARGGRAPHAPARA